jgi:hypothetical protein
VDAHNNNSSSLLAITQQLQQSKLLDKLPALLSAAAAEVTKATRMSDAEHMDVLGPEFESAQDRSPPREAADTLLMITTWLSRLQLAQDRLSAQQQQQAGMQSLLDTAHIELVYAVAQDVNRGLIKLGADESPDPRELFTLARAFGIMQLTCASNLVQLLRSPKAQMGTEPALPQVLLSPALLPCIVLVLAATAHRPAAAKQRRRNAQAARSNGAQAQASSSSSSNASFQQISPEAATLAWQQANQSCTSLEASHQQLCALLGMDVRTLLTLAGLETMFTAPLSATDSGSDTPADVEVCDPLIELHAEIMYLWGSGAVEDLWVNKTAAQQQLELQLQLLLPAVLLDCATRVPASYKVRSKYYLMAAQLSHYAAAAWSTLSKQAAATPTGGMLGLGRRRQRQQQQQQPELPGSWVAKVLPAAVKLARKVVPQLQEDANVASSAGHAAVSSSSGRSSSAASGSQHDREQLRYDTNAHRVECLEHLLCFIATVCDAVLPPVTCSEQPGAGEGASSRARFAAVLSYFNVPEDSAAAAHAAAFRHPAEPSATVSTPSAPAGLAGLVGMGSPSSGSTGQQLGSLSRGSSSQHQAVTALAGNAVHIMRVLEGFLRTAAATPAELSAGLKTLGEPAAVRPPDCPLRDLLAFAMLPTADAAAMMRNVDWDYEPAAPALLQLAVVAGAGSAEQRALSSLLCSLVKVCVLQSSKLPGVLQEPGRCILLAVEAAMHLLKLTPCSPAVTAAAGSSAAGTSVAGSSAQAVQLLPNLVIFGRLCLLYGQQLPAKIPFMVQMRELKTRCPGTPGGMSQQEYRQLIQMYSQEAPRNSVVDVLWREAPGGNGRQSKFDLFLQACLSWLQSGSVSAQLLAAGYGPATPSSSNSSAANNSSSAQALPAVKQLQALALCVAAARFGDTPDPAPFQALTQQLLATGGALSSMAVPACCNSPACGNISRTLEVSIVSGHSTKCSGCKTARYCSKVCQKAHWKQHKPVCKALSAAQAAAKVVGSV